MAGCGDQFRIHRVLGADVQGDFELPGPLVDSHSTPACTILRSQSPAPTPGRLLKEVVAATRGRVATLHETDHGLLYWADQVGTFFLHAQGQTVEYWLEPSVSRTDLEHTVGGAIVGMALQLQGRCLLHAGAVVIDGRAIAFTGPHRTGKSTLAASFANEGVEVLSDDILPLQASLIGIEATEGGRRIKLWDDSRFALGVSDQDSHPTINWLTKRSIPVPQGSQRSASLSAIVLLCPHEQSDGITSNRIEGMQAIQRLLGSMYQADSMAGTRASFALAHAATVAESVPITQLCYQRSFQNLPAIRAAILAASRTHADA